MRFAAFSLVLEMMRRMLASPDCTLVGVCRNVFHVKRYENVRHNGVCH